MRKICICFLLIFLCFNTLSAQLFQGTIKNKAGERLPGATLFIRELAWGTVASEEGFFQVTLPAGKYNCEVSHLGYEKRIVPVDVAGTDIAMEVILDEKMIMLPEVRISAKGEDPALYIMRKAIANAPRHRNQVESYTAEVYTKGSGKLDKVPRLYTMNNQEFARLVKSIQGKTLMLESLEEIRFETPDIYHAKVKAFSSTIPEDIKPDHAFGVVTSSIYDPSILGVVSPMSTGAFSYYRFAFMDSYLDGERMISKIRVTPRKKNSRLAEGILHIAEEEWSVKYFDLKVDMFGVVARVQGVFHEIKPSVFMPTSYEIDVDAKIFGIKATGKYFTSVRYTDLVVNSLPLVATENAVAADTVVTVRKSNTEIRLEQLAEKEELTTREAYRMARLSEKVFEEMKRDTTDPLEIRFSFDNIKVEVDSMAVQRDSLYWLKVRTIPLRPDEVRSYEYRDSLKQEIGEQQEDSDDNESTFSKVLSGGRFTVTDRFSIKPDGVFSAVPEYNFVDGFHIGQGISFRWVLPEKRMLRITPSLYYTTARKSMIWQARLHYNYSRMKNGYFTLQAGDRTEDYKYPEGSDKLIHSLNSLIAGNNYISYYRNEYVYISNKIDIFNGFSVQVSGRYENRKVLKNRTSYNFSGRDPHSNAPENEGGVGMPQNNSATAGIDLNYTPRMRYYIHEEQKHYHSSDWPTFRLHYKKGISLGKERENIFDLLEFGVRQKLEFGIFDYINYHLHAGQFLRKKELYFADYKHFNSFGWAVENTFFENQYLLSDYYELSTGDKWLSGAVNYVSSYLFIKRIPFLQDKMFDEALHIRYLWSPENKNYTEWGYSIGFLEAIRCGLFFNFREGKYDGMGVRVNIPLKL